MSTNWYDNICLELDKQAENIYKRDVNYFQVDRFKRMAKRISINENSCDICKNIKPELEDISKNLADYINSIPVGRRKLEKMDEQIKKHLKSSHKIYPVYYFVSFYSFIGMITGGFIGFILHFVFPDTRLLITITLPWLAGLIAGYFKGNKKDWQIRREERLL